MKIKNTWLILMLQFIERDVEDNKAVVAWIVRASTIINIDIDYRNE